MQNLVENKRLGYYYSGKGTRFMFVMGECTLCMVGCGTCYLKGVEVSGRGCILVYVTIINKTWYK